MATQKSTLEARLALIDDLTPKLKGVQSGIIRFVGAITASVVAVRGLAFPIQAAADFERELRNVQKTTGFTDVEIDRLGGSLNKLSGQLLTTQVELAQIAATAGQLGLGSAGVQGIEAFTTSVAKASATFDIAADRLAGLAAQILNIFQIDVGNLERVFSAINEVSNNSVASADALIDIIKRVGNVAGLTLQQVTALAAQSQDLGVSTEVAGTTIVKQFSRMESEAEKFAKTLNITTSEWVALLQGDALGAFKDITLAISRLDTAARADAIKDLFGGGRIFALAAKQVRDAANGFDLLDKSLQNATDAYNEGTSSLDEYLVIAGSLSGRTQQLRNTFRQLATEAGLELVPALKELTGELIELLNTEEVAVIFDGLVEGVRGLVEAITELVDDVDNFRAAWDFLLPTLKLFLTLGIAKVVIGIGKSIGTLVTDLKAFFGLKLVAQFIVVLTQKLIALTAAMIGTTVATTGLTVASTGLLGVAQKILTLLSRFAGPLLAIGAIATVVWKLFGDAIKNVLGLSEAAEDSISAVDRRKEARLDREAEQDAQRYRNRVRRELDKEELLELRLRLKDPDADIRNDAEAQIKSIVNFFNEEIAGVQGIARLAQKELETFQQPLQNAVDRAAQLRREIAQNEQILARINERRGPGLEIGEDSAQLERRRELARVESEITSIVESQAEVRGRIAETQRLEKEFQKQADEAARGTLRTTNLQQAYAVRFKDEQNKLEQVRKELTARVAVEEERVAAALEAQQEANREGGDGQAARRAESINQTRAFISELNAQLETVSKRQKEVNAGLDEAEEKLRKGSALDRAFLTFIRSGNEASIALEANSDAVQEAAKGATETIKTQTDDINSMWPALVRAYQAALPLQRAFLNFEQARRPIDAINQSLISTADNINSVISGIRRSLAAISRDVNNAINESLRNSALELEQATDPELFSIRERYGQRLLDLEEQKTKALNRGDTVLGRILSKRIAEVKAQADATEKARIAELQFESEERKVEALIGSQERVKQAADDALAQQEKARIALENAVQDGVDPDSAQFDKLLSDVLVAERAVESTGQAYRELLENLSNSARILKDLGVTVTFENGFRQTIRTSGEIESILSRIGEASGEIEQEFAANAIAAAKAAQDTSSSLQTVNTAFTTQLAEALSEFKNVGDGFATEVEKQIRGIAALQQAGVDAQASITELFRILTDPASEKSRLARVGEQIRNSVADGFKDPFDVTVTLASGAKASLEQELRNENITAEVTPVIRGNRSNLVINGRGVASGGFIRGPGSGTSDSIPAWLSNGEYVIRAAAVSKYGVGLFDRLNQMSANAPRFASGGAVGAANRVADTVSSQVEVTVNLGRERATLRGNRQNVDAFVRGLKNLESSAV